MSFTPDILNRKLEALQETQDSIVTISQWVLFHHRHSKEMTQIWADYILKLPSNNSAKKLSLLYLCNDVVQQARHKRKMDFIVDFSKVLPNVLNVIYNSLDPVIKNKVNRLINVWSERQIFSAPDIKNMRLAMELSTGNKSYEGPSNEVKSSLQGPPKETIVPELKLLNNTFQHMNKLADVNQSNMSQIGTQSKTYLPTDPLSSDNLPSPKIYISKLNVLEKLCLMTNNNLNEIKKDRAEILKLLDTIRLAMTEGMAADDNKINIINQRLEKLNSTRQDLSEMIDSSQSSKGQNTQDSSVDVEEPSPVYDNDSEDDIPTYENDSADEDAPSPKKIKPSPEANTTSTNRKSVAFSEDIEVNEYDREEQTVSIKIVKSDDSDKYDYEPEDGEDVSMDFEKKHKDDLELKHEHENGGEGVADHQNNVQSSETSGNQLDNNVLSLLSKLA